jgi:hypothetical protein
VPDIRLPDLDREKPMACPLAVRFVFARRQGAEFVMIRINRSGALSLAGVRVIGEACGMKCACRDSLNSIWGTFHDARESALLGDLCCWPPAPANRQGQPSYCARQVTILSVIAPC